jgi:pyrroline-5-carboxylate reductase
VIKEIAAPTSEKTLIISIMAGKSIKFIQDAFGSSKAKIVRTMPNTPALVGEGCTGLCFHGAVTEEERNLACKMMGSFGKAIVVEERLMDVVGAVSGSSPAFVFLFLEALADGAVAGGMPRKQAYEFAAQAVLGSAKLMLETGKHPGELKDMVCSPGGTTIEGVKALEEGGLRAAVLNAMEATIEKTRKL